MYGRRPSPTGQPTITHHDQRDQPATEDRQNERETGPHQDHSRAENTQ